MQGRQTENPQESCEIFQMSQIWTFLTGFSRTEEGRGQIIGDFIRQAD